MTLREFFEYLGERPWALLFFFIGIPFAALLAGLIGRGEGHLSPWKYFYGVLVYLACIPGVFAIALSVYFFLFERRSIMDTNVLMQILPVVSMALTIAIIRGNVSLDQVPGFDRLSGLAMMILAVFVLMFVLDRTRIIVLSYLPVQYLGLIVVGMLLLFRYGLKRLSS